MPNPHDQKADEQLSRSLLDTMIRAGLILGLVLVCYRIFSPFLTLMLWAMVLAVTLYPLHQKVAKVVGLRQGLASTLLIIAGIILIIFPCALLMSSLGDSITTLIHNVKNDTLQIPKPSESIVDWPYVGKELFQAWDQAATDLPAFIHSMQPKIGNLAKKSLEMVAAMGTHVFKFLFSLIVAGIIMAFGQSGESSALSIFRRILGQSKATKFKSLCTATIRAVALGVIGVALIQAILIGMSLFVAGIPAAGILAVITMFLGIAQIPAAIVTLPAIIYIWASGDYGSGAAIAYSILLVTAGLADNVLKPLLLGRGVDCPMPVILLGALGGMVSSGILGMFLGATLLALGYQIFMGWVAEKGEEGEQKTPPQVSPST